MKRGRSTGKPTREEEARIVACKSGPCVACEIWADHKDCPPMFRGAWVDVSPTGESTGGDSASLYSLRRSRAFGT